MHSNLRSSFQGIAIASLLVVGSLAVASRTHASSVSASYFTLASNNPDVGKAITGVVTGLVASALGPNGLPVASATSGFTNIDPVTHELLWWTAGTYVTSGTAYSYPTTPSLPFNIASSFFPNGPGGSDGANGYVSAILQGLFVTPTGGNVTFTLGSDDDAWVFVNGQLVVDNGGIHGLINAPTTVSGLLPGSNTIEVFFADRHTIQAALFFNADVQVNPVPEPTSFALLGVGLVGIGLIRRRRG